MPRLPRRSAGKRMLPIPAHHHYCDCLHFVVVVVVVERRMNFVHLSCQHCDCHLSLVGMPLEENFDTFGEAEGTVAATRQRPGSSGMLT
jgi:hypothetical protein